MGRSASAATKVPISLRLPPEIITKVGDYADAACVSKTDAFLHFLMLGFQAQEETRDSRLSMMQAQLDEILSLMRKESETASASLLPVAREAVAAAATGYEAIRQVYLFGSIARGTANAKSDIDLRLVLDRRKRFNLHDLEHFCKAVERATGREVDAITSSTIKDEALAAAIEREKVLIYEREEEQPG